VAATGVWAGAPAAAALGEEGFAPEAAEFAAEAAVLGTFFAGPSSATLVAWGVAPTTAVQGVFTQEAGGCSFFCGDALAAIVAVACARHQLRAY
jgi:hypothetical protein